MSSRRMSDHSLQPELDGSLKSAVRGHRGRGLRQAVVELVSRFAMHSLVGIDDVSSWIHPLASCYWPGSE